MSVQGEGEKDGKGDPQALGGCWCHSMTWEQGGGIQFGVGLWSGTYLSSTMKQQRDLRHALLSYLGYYVLLYSHPQNTLLVVDLDYKCGKRLLILPAF